MGHSGQICLATINQVLMRALSELNIQSLKDVGFHGAGVGSRCGLVVRMGL